MVTAGVVTWRPPRLDGLYRRAGQLEKNKGWSCVRKRFICFVVFFMCVCEQSQFGLFVFGICKWRAAVSVGV